MLHSRLMSFELRPIRKSKMPLATDRASLAIELHELAKECPITKTRKKHPTVSAFLAMKSAKVTIERFAVASDIPSHPIEAFTVHSVGKYRQVLCGAAMVVRNVDVLVKEYGNSNRKMIDGQRSVCLAWLGLGGAQELAEVNAILISSSGQGNEIAIEPQSSSPEVHEALASVYQNSIDGGFVLGQGRVTQFSTAYGLGTNNLTQLPRL